MYEYLRTRQLRKEYSKQGWALLIYYGIMNVAVIGIMLVDAFMQAFAAAASGQEPDIEQMTSAMIANSAWGYFIAIGAGLLGLLLWKKPKFCFGTIWKPGRKMTVGSFFAVFVIFTSAQLAAQLMYMLLEFLFNLGGLSIVQSMEAAGGSAESLSMFLYMGLGAPIFEEIVFRGAVLRSMEPYGKKFAIFASALLFGLYHGNIVQIPFAFAVGLVLGYVTVEYNIGWAMLLHLFNNLILSDTMTRLTADLPQPWPDLSFWIVMVGCALAALIVLIVQRKNVKLWLKKYQDDPLCKKAFWGAPGIITLVSVIGAMTLLSTVMMITVLE